MDSKTFLDHVAEANVATLRDTPDDLRLAVNAFLSVDAFVGHLAFDEKGGPISENQ
jgi:hypothetical protein